MGRGGYRPGSGPQKGTKYKPRAGKAAKASESARKPREKKPTIPQDIQDDAADANMTPMDYMLMVIRDKKIDPVRRDRMAIAAAPFCHPRKGEGQGKKEEKSDRAAKAGAGRFAASAPPVLKVVNK
jgi:phage terminase small subunit